MASRLLLLAAVACALAEEPLYSLEWPGPAEGCASAARAGGHFGVECAWGADRVVLAADANGSYLKISCQNDGGSFSCAQLQSAEQLMRARLDAPRAAANRTVDRFEVRGCALPAEPLACALRLVGAADATLLLLADVAGELTPRHVRGMTRVEKLRLYYRRGENQTAVPHDVLAMLPALTSFSLWRGELVLQPGGLPALPGLRNLELADGGLRELPRGPFRNAPGLTTLGLWGNQIESVDEDAFEGLSRLENLSLNSNRLSSLPRAVFAPTPRLARLDLYHNRLAALPAGLLSGLAHLREVYIFDNQATLHLEEHLFANLPSLQHLELKTSSIQHVPEHIFQNTTHLHKLYMSGNNLTAVPERMFHHLVELEILDLSYNQLDNLHESLFSKLDKLESLDLSSNSLKALPEGLFSGLKMLKVLNLRSNQIQTLSKTVLAGLSALLELNLAGNRIRTLHNETFRPVTGLQVLSLANNNMSISREVNTEHFISADLYAEYQIDRASPPADAFEYRSPLSELVNLRDLDLSRNRISVMCDDWRMFWSLRKLDLAHNELTALIDIDLAFSAEEVVVDLRHNRITHFLPYTYVGDAGARATPTVLLADNPFRCDCRLYPALHAQRRAARSTTVDIAGAACAAPAELRGQPLAALRPERLVCDVADCPDGCACADVPARRRLELDCRALPARLPGAAPTRLRLRQRADLSALPAHVTYVDLSSLNLTEAPSVSHSTELDLTGNHLRQVPVDLLRLNCVVHLANNPLACQCGNRAELEFLQLKQHLVRDYSNLTCSNKLLLSGVDVETLCAARDSTVVGCSIALLGLLVALVTGAVYRYQTIVRILLKKIGLWWGEEEVDDRRYDAFVSFSHQDERYVMETLVPRLESGKRPLRLCLHYRDWVVGDFIPSQIARSVEDSRRTIIVLSEHFLKSVWAQMEFRAAHGRERLLILMLDDLAKDRNLDPDLKAYIAVNTYVKASDPLVFDRLKDAVLTRRRAIVKTPKRGAKAVGLDVHLNEQGQLVNAYARAAP